MSYANFEHYLLNKAEELFQEYDVKLGTPTVTAKSLTYKPYITYGFGSYNIGDLDVFRDMANNFIDWIRNYILTAKGTKSYSGSDRLYVYWRSMPEVERDEDKIKIWARLLITKDTELTKAEIKINNLQEGL